MDEKVHQLNNREKFLWSMNLIVSMNCKECGYLFENLVYPAFCDIRKITYTAATPTDNIYNHIDWSCTTINGIYTTDVKSPKKIHRSDTAFTQNVLLEYTGVKGYQGWLHGKSDLISFYLFEDDQWYLVEFKRLELLKYIEDNYPGYGNPVRIPKGEIPPVHRWITRGFDSYIWIPYKELIDNVPYNGYNVTRLVYNSLSHYPFQPTS